MSKIDELIRELRPNDVETKKLKDFLVIKNGSDYKSFGAGDYPVYGSGGIMTYIDRYAYDKPSVLIPRKGSIDKLYYVEKPFWNVDTIFYTEIDTTKAIPRYVYYCLQQKHLEEYNTAGGVPSLTQKVLNNIEILVPPLGIQREIVRILDNFTNLTAELTAELTARKAQYSYYRDKLLSYTSTTQMEKLGDTCEMKAGKAIASGLISDECTAETPIKCYGGNGVRGYVKNANENGSYPIIGRQGALCGNVKYAEGQFYATEHAVVVKPKEKYNPRFLYHLLTNMNLNQYKSAGAQPGLAVKNIAELVAPVPPLNVQNRIVNVLDNFEKICSDLNIGLPAEIEARQKQYEYYRDKLLTFAENGNTILSRAEQSRAEQSRAEQSRALIKLLQYVFGYVRIALGDVGSICMCKRILKSQTNTVSGVPFYKIGTFGKEADAYISQETFNEYRSKYNFPKKGDVLISAAGTIGRTVIYDGKPAYFQDSNIVWIDNDESIVLNSYLRYCYELKPWKASEGGTIPRLYNDNIAKAVIAVPPIEEQKRIVSILDCFDAISNDLTSGLPAEIEARQKQYEYYRDKLLSFKELT